MSKKILKRSMALGALMAFVITGNVWAGENITNDAQADVQINANSTNVVVGGAITALEDDITISGDKDNTVLTVKGGNVVNYTSSGAQGSGSHVGIGGDFRDSEGKSVTIENIKQLNVDGSYIGVSAGSDASNIELPKGNVHITDSVETTDIKGGRCGVFAGGKDAQVVIESKNVTIEANTSGTNDVWGIGTNAGGKIELGTKENKIDNLSITGTGQRCFAIYSSNTNSEIKIFANSVVLSSNHTAIRSKGGHIYLGSMDNPIGNIVAETVGGNGLGAYSNAVIDFPSAGGSVELYGKDISLINHREGQNVISAGASGSVKIVGKEKLYIKGSIGSSAGNPDLDPVIDINTGINDALVEIEGNISRAPAKDGEAGKINITLGAEGSYLKGKIKDTVDKEENYGVTLTMNEGTKWEVTDSSNLKELAGNGGSLVLATIENDSRTELAVASVDVGINSNANLTVSGDAALTKAIEEGKVTAEKALDTLSTAVTSTNEESKTIKKFKTAEGKILGSYLRNEDGTADLQESSLSAAVSEAGMNLKAHWRAHMNDMNKRMGELRFANGETGVWTRMVRGESEYEGAKMQYNQYQLGYDEKLSVDKRWTVGAAVTFAEGDSSYGQGSSEDKSTAFAIYGSKLNNDGTFVDLIARYARIESDIEDSVYSKGEYDTNGMSVSAEFGKRIQQGNGLWIEPQVELTYGTVDSASVKFADGSVANYGDMDSLIGRVGFSIGKDIKQGNVYARASYLYDFDGETETTFTNGITSGKPVEDDFGGGWWEVGVGANINLSKATYIYADVEKTFGGEVDTNWQWNLGVRYSF